MAAAADSDAHPSLDLNFTDEEKAGLDNPLQEELYQGQGAVGGLGLGPSLQLG